MYTYFNCLNFAYQFVQKKKKHFISIKINFLTDNVYYIYLIIRINS